MFTLTTADDLIRTLADAAPAEVVPHFFSFNGIRRPRDGPALLPRAASRSIPQAAFASKRRKADRSARSLAEHNPFGKPVSTHRVKPEGTLFRIML
jgi:hypothetical protein